MENKTFISEFTENEYIQSVFLVADTVVRTTKRGDPYLCITLGDRSGSIEARAWDDAEALAERFSVDDFIEVSAQVTSYNGEIQLNINDLRRVDEEQVDVEAFLPASKWDRDEMLDQLKDLVSREVKSSSMLRFFDEFFSDDELMRKYKMAPAAKGNHHAYIGGLLEHSLSMARVGAKLARHYAHYYPGMLNQDLVIAGCVLHDVGKCFELEYTRGFRYSDSGQMVGHITQGVELVTKLADRVSPPLPSNMIMRLKHLILSHHGRLEYGSPVKARTPEAVLLHQIDMIDSRMGMVQNAFEEHASGVAAEDSWTGYNRLFDGSLYAGDPKADQWATYRLPGEQIAGPGMVPPSDQAPSRASEGGGEDGDEDSEMNLDLFPD
jgi:3'-5' exoribonuclease